MARVGSSFRTLSNVFKRNSPGAHKRARIFKQFSDTIGLLYFGLVDQHSDEHEIIRGVSISSTHVDNHFSVGTYEEYDVKLVDRQDSTLDSSGTVVTHDWVIAEVKLKTNYEMPNFYIEAQTAFSHTHTSLLTINNTIKQLRLGALENYPDEFLNRYTVYASPSDSIEVQQLITAAIARSIGAHFWPLSVEMLGNSLIIYSYKETVSTHLLNMILTDGLWLARNLDSSTGEK